MDVKHSHNDLVSVIRGVHRQLRREVKASDNYNFIWEKHCQNREVLKHYSEAMLKLATEVWATNNTRITWCYEMCIKYFYEGGLERSLKRNERLCQNTSRHFILKECPCDNTKIIALPLLEKIELLDVGSCYNPFNVFHEFNCTALDLEPATKDVLKCDFLNIKITDTCKHEPLFNPVKCLSSGSFHVIVFSLVLEYLPVPEQRWKFCCNARELLQENGLLLIITPDSKSQYHNSSMISSWKHALSCLGFYRVAYEKQTHMHCIAFQKVSRIMIKKSVYDNAVLEKMIYIPQDFYDYNPEENYIERTTDEDQSVSLNFCELPFDCTI